MPTIIDKELYELVKSKADEVYKKPSAYKSGYIVKTYKKMGGRYKDDNKQKNLKRWFKEKWEDVGHKKYPVYRPTIRINEFTPLTIHEIDMNFLKKQINRKQIIKGNKNLPPFKASSSYLKQIKNKKKTT